MLERGVYTMPYRCKRGHRMLAAIDSNGRKVHEARMFDGECELEVTAMLRRLLDRDDPQPKDWEVANV